MVRVGIDPGVSGGLAFIDQSPNGRFCEIKLFDMPTRTIIVSKKEKKEVDGLGLSVLFRAHMIHAEELYVNLESVHAMAKQGVTSMFNFGQGYGVIKGVLEALCINYRLVTPQQWKKQFSLIGTEKDEARLKAIELYPSAAKSLARKKDGGRADALLIGAYESQ